MMAALAGANPNYGIGDPGGSFVGIGAMTRACNVPNALQPTIPGGGLLGPDGYVSIWSNPGYDITPPVVSGALGGSGSTNSGGGGRPGRPWHDFNPVMSSPGGSNGGSKTSFGGSRPAGGLGIAPDLMKKGKKSDIVKKPKSSKKPNGIGVSATTGKIKKPGNERKGQIPVSNNGSEYILSYEGWEPEDETALYNIFVPNADAIAASFDELVAYMSTNNYKTPDELPEIVWQNYFGINSTTGEKAPLYSEIYYDYHTNDAGIFDSLSQTINNDAAYTEVVGIIAPFIESTVQLGCKHGFEDVVLGEGAYIINDEGELVNGTLNKGGDDCWVWQNLFSESWDKSTLSQSSNQWVLYKANNSPGIHRWNIFYYSGNPTVLEVDPQRNRDFLNSGATGVSGNPTRVWIGNNISSLIIQYFYSLDWR